MIGHFSDELEKHAGFSIRGARGRRGSGRGNPAGLIKTRKEPGAPSVAAPVKGMGKVLRRNIKRVQKSGLGARAWG